MPRWVTLARTTRRFRRKAVTETAQSLLMGNIVTAQVVLLLSRDRACPTRRALELGHCPSIPPPSPSNAKAFTTVHHVSQIR